LRFLLVHTTRALQKLPLIHAGVSTVPERTSSRRNWEAPCPALIVQTFPD
jgi:hypothetical protein